MDQIICAEFELVVDLGSRNRWSVYDISYLSPSNYHGHPGRIALRPQLKCVLWLFPCNSVPLS